MTARRVTLLYASGFESGHGSSLATESSRLSEVLARPEGVAAIDIISVGIAQRVAHHGEHVDVSDVDAGLFDRLVRALGGEWLRRRFAQFPLGRLLNSMGPLDAGRTFDRRVRRSTSALAAVRDADVIIAVDSAGVTTAARALRKRWVTEAYYDSRSAALGLSDPRVGATGD